MLMVKILIERVVWQRNSISTNIVVMAFFAIIVRQQDSLPPGNSYVLNEL